MILVFTLCSNNYLAQAITLGNSLIKHNPEYIFKIVLVDKKNSQVNYSSIPYEVIEIENILIEDFNEMFRRYNIIELNTAVKPFIFAYFFYKYNKLDSIIYLDPDICVYNSFSILENELREYDIIITPHCLSPINDNKLPSENEFLNSGLYNLGFIAIKNGSESKKLLDWWSDRLKTKAYIDFAKGMFTDQIWFNFVPLFFEKVRILKHVGFNVAYWNIHERNLVNKYEVCFNKEIFPLIFFHFSGYDPQKPKILSKYQDRFTFEKRSDLVEIFDDYANELFANDYLIYVKYQCCYSVEKQKLDMEAYSNYKNSIAISKRILRGIILRIIKMFRVNIDYYTR